MTQQTKHTPAPWAIDVDKHGIISVCDKDYNAICEMGGCLGDDVDKINALLILESPAMLQMLKTVLLADEHDGALTMGDASLSPAIKAQIQSVIDKAEGKA